MFISEKLWECSDLYSAVICQNIDNYFLIIAMSYYIQDVKRVVCHCNLCCLIMIQKSSIIAVFLFYYVSNIIKTTSPVYFVFRVTIIPCLRNFSIVFVITIIVFLNIKPVL